MRFLCGFLLLLFSCPGFGTQVKANDFGLIGGNRAFSLQVTSFKAQRFENVVPQQYDFSCGSAALATLLRFHYNIPVTEQDVLDAMYKVGDQAKIKSQGFSLLDMKQYLGSMGFRADGFRVDIAKMRKVGIPGIVLINTNGYMHFVVIKGVNDTHVLLGDPAQGERKLTHADFQKIWNDIFFVIRNETHLARLNFDHEDEWEQRKQIMFNKVISNQALSTFSVHTAISPNIYF